MRLITAKSGIETSVFTSTLLRLLLFFPAVLISNSFKIYLLGKKEML